MKLNLRVDDKNIWYLKARNSSVKSVLLQRVRSIQSCSTIGAELLQIWQFVSWSWLPSFCECPSAQNCYKYDSSWAGHDYLHFVNAQVHRIPPYVPRLNELTLSHSTSLWPDLILSSYPHSGSSKLRFISGFPIKILYALLHSTIIAYNSNIGQITKQMHKLQRI